MESSIKNFVNTGEELTMTSRQIAEITGKRHADVIRAIKTMEPAWTEANQRSFALVEYRDDKGEMRPQYLLTKMEVLYVATKFNDLMRAKLVLRWEELEKEKQGSLALQDASAIASILADQNESIAAVKQAVNYVAAIAGSLKRVDEALEEIENRRDPQLISIPEYLRTIKKHVSFEIAKNISKRAIALSIESAKPMGLEEDIKFGTVRTYNTEILEAAYVDVIHKPQI